MDTNIPEEKPTNDNNISLKVLDSFLSNKINTNNNKVRSTSIKNKPITIYLAILARVCSLNFGISVVIDVGFDTFVSDGGTLSFFSIDFIDFFILEAFYKFICSSLIIKVI